MGGERRMRQVGIRIDDVCPTMNYQKFETAMALLEKYKVKPLLGIVPDCKDPDLKEEEPHENFWEMVRNMQKSGCIIAMHGYRHCYDIDKRGNVNDRTRSEFAGHPYEIQYEKIQKGKKILEEQGIFTEIFFAPSHSYDSNTLKALHANGFKYISDGRSHKAYKQCGVICVPCRSFGLPKMKKNGNYTVVLHPSEWGKEEKVKEEKKFIDFCQKYHKEFISYEKYLNKKTGNYFFQKLDELLYLLYLRNIKRFVLNVLRKVNIT